MVPRLKRDLQISRRVADRRARVRAESPRDSHRTQLGLAVRRSRPSHARSSAIWVASRLRRPLGVRGGSAA